MSYSIIPPRTPWQLPKYLLGYELLVNHYLRPHFTPGRVANRVVFSLSCTWQNNHYTNICAARRSVHTLSNAPPPTCPQTDLWHCVSCVCVCARARVASLSMYPISHIHSSSARRSAVYSRPITRLSVKRLEFIRDTESCWQLPTDLTRVYKRGWSDPLGGYHCVNKDIVSLERKKRGRGEKKRKKRRAKTTQIHKNSLWDAQGLYS